MKRVNIQESIDNIHKKVLRDSVIVDCSTSIPIVKLKYEILQLGAALDRGQAYNPTSGDYYANKMAFAKDKIESLYNLASNSGQNHVVKTLQDIEGEWELVLTTVPHGIFRSSPFFFGNTRSVCNCGCSRKG